MSGIVHIISVHVGRYDWFINLREFIMSVNNRARCFKCKEFYNKVRFSLSAKITILMSNLRVGVMLKTAQPMEKL